MALIFIQQQIRQVLFFLDNAVFSLMSKVYELILYLSNVNLVDNNPVLEGLISRVYLILGIFMLFKVSFSIIQYIVDPNAFSDSAKGFGKLITNTMVSLVLLVSVPFIFEKAYDLQELIISSNAIPNLVLGTNLPDNAQNSDAYNDRKDEMVSMAKDIEFAIFGAFATINDDDKIGFGESCKSRNEYPAANVIGTNDMIKSGCYKTIESEMVNELGNHGGKLSDFFKYEADESVVTHEKCPGGICDDRNFSAYASLLWWAKSDTFVINYFPFVPTIIGGYLLFLLVAFAIDIAARVFKLMFLQAVAPISIISYIDPKESASNSKLYKWVRETISTFVSLFLRLAIIFLIVELVNMITSKIFLPITDSVYNEGITPSSTMHIFVYIFLILGLFAFAKQVPTMIENLFPGMKGSGDLNLNPFKTFRENTGLQLGLGAAAIGGATLGAGAVNALASGGERFAEERANGASFLRAAGLAGGRSITSGLGGMIGAGRRSIAGAARGEKAGKNFTNSFGAAMFARQQRADLNRQGSTVRGRVMADVERNLGIMNAAQRQQLNYDRDEGVLKRFKQQRSDAASPYKQYGDIISAMNSEIENTKLAKDAERAYNEALGTGDEEHIKSMHDAWDQAKVQAFNNMMTDETDSKYQLMQQYAAQLDTLRRNNDGLQADNYDYITTNDSGQLELNKTAMFQSQTESTRLENAPLTTDEIRQLSRDFVDEHGATIDLSGRTVADAEAYLASRKNTDRWKRNELDNSSRGVSAPQPEGWTPHAGYGPTGYGVGGWYSGNQGGPGPGPGPHA